MNIQNSEFYTSVYDYFKLPELVMPEVVFAGRSNVGKSSMINKLLSRKSIARVSSSPGKTACINYYNIDNKMFLTDLPGYGFAKVAKGEKERWSLLIDGFFSINKNIKLIVLLVDIRHKPTFDDLTMLNFLKNKGKNFIIVLTKSDKLSKTAQLKRVEEIRGDMGLEKDAVVIPFSAQTGDGSVLIWDNIKAAVIENEIC